MDKYIRSNEAEDAVRACCLEASACNLQCIKDIPAADVRPVKRARWVYYDSFALNCSRCRWINYHNMGVPNIYNYCPNCGADMREEN